MKLPHDTLEGTLISAPQPVGKAPPGAARANIMRILCPHCRRVAVFEEIT